ncbi:hypothetical protein CISIN_1g023816mg [Citrus sinensis]|uniref:Response regulatory domain-containing protein n=1 Tax=Citrus sinensis TaxID=2711 RepID=A0A067GVC7_CITSI|nr:hypothetical protein CISIN_1g023816mg [Citrus sinensis]
MTTTNGVASLRLISDEIDGFDLSPSDTEEVHVLAVDDSFVDRKVIERLLTISSCKVTAVDSGRRALQFLGLDEEQSINGFDGLKVDLIITDYCMPGMTGYELLKKIKVTTPFNFLYSTIIVFLNLQNLFLFILSICFCFPFFFPSNNLEQDSSALREIPVVIMSSENILARIDRCLEDGAEDFIVKPVKLSDVKRIKDYLTRDVNLGNEGRGINKRKARESCDLSSSPPSVITSSSSPSSPSSPFRSPSILSSSAPCSPPSTLDSPTSRLKMTISD